MRDTLAPSGLRYDAEELGCGMTLLLATPAAVQAVEGKGFDITAATLN